MSALVSSVLGRRPCVPAKEASRFSLLAGFLRASGHPGNAASSLVFSFSDRHPHGGFLPPGKAIKLSMHESFSSFEKCLLQGKSSGIGKIPLFSTKVTRKQATQVPPGLRPLPCTHLPRMGSKKVPAQALPLCSNQDSMRQAWWRVRTTHQGSGLGWWAGLCH